MIARDASPIAHVPPMPRIDLSARTPRHEPVVIELDLIGKLNEQNRIWQLVRQAAGAPE